MVTTQDIPTDTDPDNDVKRIIAQRIMRKRNWNVIGYDPSIKQQMVHAAIDRGCQFININAGTRFGKTIMAAEVALEKAAVPPPEGVPLGIIPIIAPYAELTDKCFRWLWHWIVNKRVYGYAPRKKSERERYIEMPWGMRIEGKTAESPDTLLGDGYIFVIVDESARIKESIYERYIERALLDNRAGVMLISTPVGRNNHHYKRHMAWGELAKADPNYFTMDCTSYDNPHLPEGAVAEMEERYRRQGMHDVFRQECLADFLTMSGAVYPNFQPMKDGKSWHVQEFGLNHEQPIYLGIDWGFKNPFVCLFAQITGDDRVLIFDEIYRSGMTDDECARAVIAKLAEYNLKVSDVEQGFADPSSPEGKQTFRNHGISMYEPRGERKVKLNDVSDGIVAVRGLYGREDKPGIVWHPRCVNGRRETEGYCFSEKSHDDKPVKVNDHAPDAKRYLVVGGVGASTGRPFIYIPGGKVNAT